MHFNEDLDDLRENYFHQSGIETFALASVLVKVGGIQLPFSSSKEILRPLHRLACFGTTGTNAGSGVHPSVRPMDAMPPPSSLPCRLMLLHLSVIGRVPDFPPRARESMAMVCGAGGGAPSEPRNAIFCAP